jgi:macrolide transport system ATP-binding/permease protein
MLGEFLRKLRYHAHRRQFEADLDEEVRHHLSFTPQDQFGNVTLLKEQSRAMWTWTFWEQFTQDLHYALRTMNTNRAFTALAVLSLALGIGANTAIYSFMDAILMRSLPVPNAESLVTLNWRGKEQNSRVVGGSVYHDPKTGFTSDVFPFPAYELFQKNESIFSTVFAYCGAGKLSLSVKEQTDIAYGQYVSGDYFNGLQLPPAAGRLILPDDDRAGTPAVAVVSFALSQRRFGGAANAPGQSISINSIPFTVVGVTPPEFFGLNPARAPDFYIPLHSILLLEPAEQPGSTRWQFDQNFYWVEMMGRLRPGVSLTQAQAALAPQFREWEESTANKDQERADLPALVLKEGAGGLDVLRRQYSKPLYLLMTLVGFILAIACANIANLLLARTTARRREMALRLSVGASRFRIIRQLLTESVVLASGGGLLGVFIAIWSIRFLSLLLATGQTNLTLRAELNWHVLGVTAALSLLTGVLFGLAPALQSTRVDVIRALKEIGSGRPRSRLRVSLSQVLIVSQIGASLLILVAAGLFLRTLSNLQSIELGFNSDNILLFNLNARQAGHGTPEIFAFYRDLQKRFSEIPGVRNASLSTFPLISESTLGLRVSTSGPLPQRGSPVLTVGPAFFATMQIPILLGREFDERDRPETTAVAVVNEKFAQANFGGQNPLGRRLKLGGAPADAAPQDLEIVGVARNARYDSLKRDVPALVYVPYNQLSFPPASQMTYALRTAGTPLALVNTIREIAHQADARVPVTNVNTQAAQIDETINQEIAFAKLCTAFAILALVIACVGLYGTISYNVARRAGEIGIRIALGARRGNVVQMILRQVVTLTALGLAIGLPTALATSKLVASFLYGTKPNDPMTLALAVATLLCAALLAGYAPARRASRIDPMTALRNE